MTITTTPAEIPAEAATAQHTHYEPAYPIDLIREHPKNIRHNATADDELVNSIRDQGLLQPLVAFKDPSIEGAELIAGHRRLDGLRKAGYTHAPVILRYDLADEGDQVAAMLVENGRRADLTPIEEAEGFDLLTELGWDVEQIAQASGRSKTLIKERRKLTALPDKAKAAVDRGQITIDDALTLAKLPPAEQTKLEKQVDTPNFRYEVRRAEERAKARAIVDAEKKRLKAAGVPELKVPGTVQSPYSLSHADHGCVRLATTGHPDASQHNGCLAFVDGGTKQYPALWEVCTDPGKHDADLSAAQLASKAEREAEDAQRAAEQAARQQAHREKQESERVARQLRADTLLAGIKFPGVKLDPTLQRLLALGLPEIVASLDGLDEGLFQDLAGVPDDQRWEGWVDLEDQGDPGTVWLNSLVDAKGPALVKALAALLVAQLEQRLQSYAPDRAAAALAPQYFDALAAVGHEKNSADQQLLAKFADNDEEA